MPYACSEGKVTLPITELGIRKVANNQFEVFGEGTAYETVKAMKDLKL